MSILIVYGTTEGQTRKIAQFTAERLVTHGHTTTLVDVTDPDNRVYPQSFDAVVVAASLHTGHYQTGVVHFARDHHIALNAMPTVFISVSLSAAGDDPDDWEGLEKCVAAFCHQTQWTPAKIYHVAGAFRFTQYDFFKRWAMKYIAHRRGQPTDTSRDYELTDWDGLGRFVDGFAKTLKSNLSDRPVGIP